MSTLYKYIDPRRIKDVLEGKRLCFSPIKALNDVNELSEDIGDVADFLMNAPVDGAYEEWCKLPVHSRPTFEKYIDLCKLNPHNRMIIMQRSQFLLSHARFAKLGVLCLSKTPDNNLMWGHYTRNGSGVCIGFNPNSLIFQDSKLPNLSGAIEVNYSSDRPKRGKEMSEAEHLNKRATTKSSHWCYEQEVRCFRLIEKRKPRLLVSFESCDVREIIIGPRATLKDARSCYELSQYFSKAKLLLAVPHFETYKMTLFQAPDFLVLEANMEAIRGLRSHSHEKLLSILTRS